MSSCLHGLLFTVCLKVTPDFHRPRPDVALSSRHDPTLTAVITSGGKPFMRRVFVAIFIFLVAPMAFASDAIFSLSGWAEIPSTFRRPGIVSGQFQTGSNGVTPPYAGQPIPGFSGMIPSTTPGRFLGLPDNGYGAQDNSADFTLGFYEVTPVFKTTSDGSTSRGPVAVNS